MPLGDTLSGGDPCRLTIASNHSLNSCKTHSEVDVQRVCSLVLHSPPSQHHMRVQLGALPWSARFAVCKIRKRLRAGGPARGARNPVSQLSVRTPTDLASSCLGPLRPVAESFVGSMTKVRNQLRLDRKDLRLWPPQQVVESGPNPASEGVGRRCAAHASWHECSWTLVAPV